MHADVWFWRFRQLIQMSLFSRSILFAPQSNFSYAEVMDASKACTE
ncbi:hypothetical protein PLUTE_a2971 [Pseudoalteromonas luteoviolacea DSM 6061]|nr:hypothetical protein [Pseudoalteromonas luteoviolacea DSM 6061]